MRLNQDQLTQLKAHLQHTFRNPCHICGTGNWQFDDVLFELREFVGGGLSTTGVLKPLVAVTCGGCGHVVMVNAISAGVIRVVQDGMAAPDPNLEAASVELPDADTTNDEDQL